MSHCNAMPVAAIGATIVLLGLAVQRMPASEGKAGLVFCCSEANDLYRAVVAGGLRAERADSPAQAVRAAPQGGAVAILAAGYPRKTTLIPAKVLQEAKDKKLRLYVEYPGTLAGLTVSRPRPAGPERVVVSSDLFGPGLKPGRILAAGGLHFVGVSAARSHLVAARVAGFDRAVFGLPKKTSPILFEHAEGTVLVATTKLSHFVTGRYAPSDAWRAMWSGILRWLMRRQRAPRLVWEATVRPAYGRDDPLPADAELQALRRGVEWFGRSKLLLHPSRQDEVDRAMRSGGGRAPTPPADAPVGDGSLGILEAPLSIIQPDGSQWQSVARRGDCVCESAMALAFGGRVLKDPKAARVAGNLLDYWHVASDARKGGRGDPKHPAYGLIAWGISSPAWHVANYGDDNARVMLGTLAAAALTGQDRWDRPVMLCLLANLRTTGPGGTRPGRIDMGPLATNGWEHYFQLPVDRIWPHYDAYLWACFLWAYRQTGYELFLQRAKTALGRAMELGPAGWRWTNGLAQERARLLLPLAWLVRAEDTPEHRRWLRTVAEGLLALQQPCGAIREELGPPGRGSYAPPASNEAYGSTEASLIQQNGDPVCDLLYTTNFAFLALHEAAEATGEKRYRQAADKLAAFLCRIQTRSDAHPSLDGGWFRAFDYRRWEAWGSNADAGWGAWSIESGWTQGWITAVLAMRQMKTSLWALTADSKIEKHFDQARRAMLPDEALARLRKKIEGLSVTHAAKGKPVGLAAAPDPRYAAGGAAALTDGRLAGEDHTHRGWLGFWEADLTATVDLGRPMEIKTLALRCLQKINVGIFLPTQVEFSVSEDGKRFQRVAVAKPKALPAEGGAFVEQLIAGGLDARARHVRVRAVNTGKVPSWHGARGQKAWLFADELLVNPRAVPGPK